MARPHLTTPLSAALTLVSWIQTNKRFPSPRECRASTVGIHWTTLYNVLPGSSFSAMVSAALDIAGMCLTGKEEPFLSPEIPQVKIRRCLGAHCDATFPDQGAHVRFCERCRKRISDSVVEEPDPLVTRADMRRFGIGMADWDDIMEWGDHER